MYSVSFPEGCGINLRFAVPAVYIDRDGFSMFRQQIGLLRQKLQFEMMHIKRNVRSKPDTDSHVNLYWNNLNTCSAVSARFFPAVSGSIASSAVVTARRIGKYASIPC